MTQRPPADTDTVKHLGNRVAQDALSEVEEGEVTCRAQVSSQLNFASNLLSCGAENEPEGIGTKMVLMSCPPQNIPTDPVRCRKQSGFSL